MVIDYPYIGIFYRIKKIRMIGMDGMAPHEWAGEENLKNYKVMFTKPEPIFDQLAGIAATMLNAPLAMINFIDRSSVWTGQKEELTGNDAETSMCSLAILKGQEAHFQTAAQQLFLISNPLIAAEYGLKFYAAAPITTNDGFHVGTVCIVDRKKRNFSAEEQQKLEWVAAMVRLEMNKRTALNFCA